MKMIYLDNGASTEVDPKVIRKMTPFFSEVCANPSSAHQMGSDAHRALEDARHVIAKSIGAKDEEIIFTSGGTESNNLAIKGLAFYQKESGTGKNHIITTKIEHSCVKTTCEWLKTQGFEVTWLDVDSEGFVDLDQLRGALRDETFLVTIIHGNNEIGTVQDLKAISEICHDKGVHLHTDACQSFTKVDVNVGKMGLDLVTLNSHKIHGPKGVGALYVRDGISLTPVSHGGNHEAGRRAGTENVSGIVGFAEAVKVASKSGHVKDMIKLRDYFIDQVLVAELGVKLNGPRDEGSGSKRLCNNMNLMFPVNGGMLGDYLNVSGICSSKGSACSSQEKGHVSHVLKAIGLTDDEAKNTIRFSLSRFSTKKEIEKATQILIKSIQKVANSRFA